ncbi:hypothetical protein RJT34_25434 [Clitoria ternatea]|uniref:Uncharacterized protein n=1 Tax=Clitoria ternatea TaxID=43366 RepID=A0AAN9FPZ4_CLITE
MARPSSKIPIEIVSDDEIVSNDMSPIHSHTPTPKLNRYAISIHSVSVQAKRRLFMCSQPDIEDYGNMLSTRKKKSRTYDTLLHRFRSKKGLFVSDVTKTEWCEKQMEFSLFNEEWKNNEANPYEELAHVFGRGRKCNNEAIQAGIDRHVQLQQEVQKLVEVKVKSREDVMALKLVNFINGVNQLLFEGLTRELPIISFAFAQGIWMRDQSLLDEEKFVYDESWIMSQISCCLEFWLGQREVNYVAEEEDWKCRYCDFASECPAAYTDSESMESLSTDYSSE